MDERRLRVRDPPDVDVELPSLDHPKRLKLLRIHVLQVLRQLLCGNHNGPIGRRLLEDDGLPLTTAASLAALRTKVRAHGEECAYQANGHQDDCLPSHGLSSEVELEAELHQASVENLRWLTEDTAGGRRAERPEGAVVIHHGTGIEQIVEVDVGLDLPAAEPEALAGSPNELID